jgi:D-alanyl-D-alanine carboxypeptidase
MIKMTIWKRFKRFLLISTIFTIGIASCTTKVNNEDDILPELSFAQELQEAIDKFILMHPDYELGISAAVIVPGHRTWTGVSGFSHQGVPITTDMLFDVASIQKNFEAALVLKLVEDNVLSLDDPISNYLPSYPNVDDNITIRQLLNHTSGVFDVMEHPDFPLLGTDVDYSKEWKEEEVFDTFVLDPYGPPGHTQHYSNTNYLLITTIIEEVTGSTVPDEIEHFFLEPMNMEKTFVSMGELPPVKYSIAHPWVDINFDGNLDDLYGIPQTWIASLTHPVMFSTPTDLVHWTNELYHQGTVLSASSLTEMLTYPEVPYPDPQGVMFGLGVQNYTNFLQRQQVFGHTGWGLGYSSAALYLPEYGISLTWFINTGHPHGELSGYNILIETWSLFSSVLENNQDQLP